MLLTNRFFQSLGTGKFKGFIKFLSGFQLSLKELCCVCTAKIAVRILLVVIIIYAN